MIALGTFPVVAAAADVAAFRASIGLDPANPAVPLTYPMRWLVMPEVRTAIVAMVAESDLVLVHEAQTFEYERALQAGEPYRLDLSAKRDTAPDRLLVEATVVAAAGPILAKIETVLRLFSTSGATP